MSTTAALRLHRFHGGLRLDAHKAESTAGPILACPLPERLELLLPPAPRGLLPEVATGDRVLRGQRIATPSGQGTPMHAPAAGTVLVADPTRIVIDVTPSSTAAAPLPPLDPEHESAEVLLARIRDAGIVGLGGAGFPTAEKLAGATGIGTLIINGAECEPWIACDDALLRERADQVVHGARLLGRVLGAARILLAVEDSMGEALAAAGHALAEPGARVELVAVPTIYPEGGERQLIQVLTGLEVPRGGLPRDLGVLVHNVGTAAAAWRAVVHGEPLLTRIVTVTGPGVARPGNFEVAFGTPVSHLVEQAGGYTERAERLLLGGPMMGRALPHDGFPIGKADNCVLVLGAAELRDRQPEMPCIRCGDCASVCPARLQPQQLLWHLRGNRPERAEAEGLADCIECGCCDFVCPSHIPLTEQYRAGKHQSRLRQQAHAQADAARVRYEARQQRLAREAAERAEREQARRQQLASADAVAAAIERAKARRKPGKDATP